MTRDASSQPPAAGYPIVLQARMGSRRFPGKVLADLAGRPLLERCVRRLEASAIGPVVIATSDRAADDPIAAEGDRLGVRVFRGPEEDVLQRFALVADYLDARFFIRATADNPAVDIDAPTRVMAALLEAGADHAVERDLPLGAAVEAVRTSALFQALAQAHDPYDREHVTPYLYRTPSRFVALCPPAPQKVRRPDVRLTVDTPADLEFLRALYARIEAGRGPASLTAFIAAADGLARERGAA